MGWWWLAVELGGTECSCACMGPFERHHHYLYHLHHSFSLVAQSCLTLCNPVNRSTPGLLVYYQLPEFTQIHVHRVSDAIQPFHPPSSPSPPAPIPPSIRVFSNESTLHIRWTKYWSFSFSISPSSEHPGVISFRMDGWISIQSKGLSNAFSNTTVQKHQFFGAQLSSQSNSHIHT